MQFTKNLIDHQNIETIFKKGIESNGRISDNASNELSILRGGKKTLNNLDFHVQPGQTIAFVVTDMAETVPVSYRGILPDLFREGQGVVAEGHMSSEGTFVASEVLAKHDENYMPPEVAESLKKSGYWEEIEAKNAEQMRN